MPKKRLTQYDMIGEMHRDIKQIKEELIPNIKADVSALKIKSGIWSSMTGILGGAFAIITLKLWK